MAVANTLAYYVTATITAVKSFIVQAPAQKRFYRIDSNFSSVQMEVQKRFPILWLYFNVANWLKIWIPGPVL